jgi:lysophospholipase L1-like esterase
MNKQAMALVVAAVLVLESFLILTAVDPEQSARYAPNPSGSTRAEISTLTAAPRSAPGPWLPNPVDYSVLGDSISTGYDANGSLWDFGEQPYYSYGVGWNTTVFSLWKRLEAIYGPNSVTPHLIAVPGDTSLDLTWQANYAVQNHSGFVSVLIGGNDACSSPEPTPVWNFSESLNRTFTTLRDNLGPNVVITLGNVVNVSQLGELFAGNLQAMAVYSQTCPILNQVILGNATAASQLAYMISAYNKIEQQIVKVYNVIPWDINSFQFTSDDVNTLDYFHPSVLGQSLLASMWWSQLPYAKMFPRMEDASYPSELPQGTPLNMSVFAWDVVPASVSVTYQGPGMTTWATASLNLQSGVNYNGTFGLTLPSNATASPGTLNFYLSANDTEGGNSTLPWSAPSTVYSVRVTSTTAPVISSFTAFPNPVVAGQATTFNVTVSAGNPPYSYSFTGMPTGCQSANVSSISCSPSVPGNFTVYAFVNDSVGLSVVSPAYIHLEVTRAVTLSSITVTPVSVSLSPQGTQVFTALPHCAGGVCPDGTMYSWTLTSGLGVLGSTTGSSVTFTAGNSAGEVSLFVNATLNSVTVESPPAAIVILSQSTPVLTGVAVDPSSAMVQVGSSLVFNATPVCGTSSCVGTVAYVWDVNQEYGSLSSLVGETTTFRAGSNVGNTMLTVTGDLNGITKDSTATITITTSAVPVVVSISISPISVNVPVGGSEQLTSFATCSPAPCLTSPTYIWSVEGALGSLSTNSGQTTVFLAGNSPGEVNVTVTASLNGKEVQNTSTVTITQSGSGTNGSLTGGDIILIVIIAAVGVVAIVTVLLLRRTHRAANQQSPPQWPGSQAQEAAPPEWPPGPESYPPPPQ